MKTKGWFCVRIGSNPVDEVHVVPRLDLINHRVWEDECVCGPAVEPVMRPDGSNMWMYTHHSLDGREINE